MSPSGRSGGKSISALAHGGKNLLCDHFHEILIHLCRLSLAGLATRLLQVSRIVWCRFKGTLNGNVFLVAFLDVVQVVLQGELVRVLAGIKNTLLLGFVEEFLELVIWDIFDSGLQNDVSITSVVIAHGNSHF